MLATFVIALREGLEAALIVSIIAAFLRKNGKSLSAMWVGVTLAVVLSIIVGVALDITERALPQASQESMEAIIGLVAVFFVTGMVMWMNTHAKDIKKELETGAAEAISQSSAFALASMAFLAVLKEGFETSVFLLATFSVAQSAIWAAAGAVIGLLMAVIIGWGFYVGGIRINLARFFRYTGMFLILVAAGLIISSLRSAHEAGWLNIGQDRIANLMWLVPPGTVQSALISGVLGVPTDPRQIEMAGWLLYIILVAVLIYWPARLRPSNKVASRLLLALAGIMAVAAVSLFSFYPQAQLDIPDTAPLSGTSGHVSLNSGNGSSPQLQVELAEGPPLQIKLHDTDMRTYSDQGIAMQEWVSPVDNSPAGASPTVTLEQVMALYGNRIPIGLNPSQHPGPYDAKWTINCRVTTTASQGRLVSAMAQAQTFITLTGSGLQSPRTIGVRSNMPDTACDWQVTDAYRQQVLSQLKNQQLSFETYRFWAHLLPAFLALLAAICLIVAKQKITRQKSMSTHTLSRTTLPDNK